MRRLLYVTLSILLALAGCRQGSVDSPRLVELDSLIAVAPDSAAALLAVYPDDSLRTDDDRAYHALLLTQAKYKAYIPAYRLDTINLAVAHYADGHDTDKRTRSLLYKGCVFEDLSRLDSAMYYYLEACHFAQSQGQHEHQAYLMFRIAQLYQYSYAEQDQAVHYYRESLHQYRQLGDSLHALYCLSELAALYRNTCPDSVVPIAHYAIGLAHSLHNDIYYCANLETLAGHYLYADDYIRAKELALKALSEPSVAPATAVRSLNTACQALAMLGKADSAQWLLSQIPDPVTAIDSTDLMRSQAMMAYAKGDLVTFITLNRELNEKAGNLLIASLKHQLAETQTQYEAEQEGARHARVQLRGMIVLVILLALLLALSLYLFYQYRRSTRSRLEWEHARAQLSSQLALMSGKSDADRLHIQTVTQALASVSYLGKKGSSSFKDDKDLVSVTLPEQFWNDADQLVSINLEGLLRKMDERGETLKAEERKILSMCYCGIPDVVIAKLMDYTNRQTVQNIKSRVARKLSPDGGSLAEILGK